MGASCATFEVEAERRFTCIVQQQHRHGIMASAMPEPSEQGAQLRDSAVSGVAEASHVALQAAATGLSVTGGVDDDPVVAALASVMDAAATPAKSMPATQPLSSEPSREARTAVEVLFWRRLVGSILHETPSAVEGALRRMYPSMSSVVALTDVPEHMANLGVPYFAETHQMRRLPPVWECALLEGVVEITTAPEDVLAALRAAPLSADTDTHTRARAAPRTDARQADRRDSVEAGRARNDSDSDASEAVSCALLRAHAESAPSMRVTHARMHVPGAANCLEVWPASSMGAADASARVPPWLCGDALVALSVPAAVTSVAPHEQHADAVSQGTPGVDVSGHASHDHRRVTRLEAVMLMADTRNSPRVTAEPTPPAASSGASKAHSSLASTLLSPASWFGGSKTAASAQPVEGSAARAVRAQQQLASTPPRPDKEPAAETLRPKLDSAARTISSTSMFAPRTVAAMTSAFLHETLQDISAHPPHCHLFVCTEDELYNKASLTTSVPTTTATGTATGNALEDVGALRSHEAWSRGTLTNSHLLYGACATFSEVWPLAAVQELLAERGLDASAVVDAALEEDETLGSPSACAVTTPRSVVVLSRFPIFDVLLDCALHAASAAQIAAAAWWRERRVDTVAPLLSSPMSPQKDVLVLRGMRVHVDAHTMNALAAVAEEIHQVHMQLSDLRDADAELTADGSSLSSVLSRAERRSAVKASELERRLRDLQAELASIESAAYRQAVQQLWSAYVVQLDSLRHQQAALAAADPWLRIRAAQPGRSIRLFSSTAGAVRSTNPRMRRGSVDSALSRPRARAGSTPQRVYLRDDHGVGAAAAMENARADSSTVPHTADLMKPYRRAAEPWLWMLRDGGATRTPRQPADAMSSPPAGSCLRFQSERSGALPRVVALVRAFIEDMAACPPAHRRAGQPMQRTPRSPAGATTPALSTPGIASPYLPGASIALYRVGCDLRNPETMWMCACWGLPTLLRLLPPVAIAHVVAALLTEQNVVFVASRFHSSNLDILARCVMGVLPLIMPLTWEQNLRPVAPAATMAAVAASGPDAFAQANLIGVTAYGAPPAALPGSDDCTVITLDTGNVHSSQTALSSHLHMPGVQDLITSLESALHRLAPVLTVDATQPPTADELAACRVTVAVVNEHVRWLLAHLFVAALPRLLVQSAALESTSATAVPADLRDEFVVDTSLLPAFHDMQAAAQTSGPFWARFGGSQVLRQHVQLRHDRILYSVLSAQPLQALTRSHELIVSVLQEAAQHVVPDVTDVTPENTELTSHEDRDSAGRDDKYSTAAARAIQANVERALQHPDAAADSIDVFLEDDDAEDSSDVVSELSPEPTANLARGISFSFRSPGWFSKGAAAVSDTPPQTEQRTPTIASSLRKLLSGRLST